MKPGPRRTHAKSQTQRTILVSTIVVVIILLLLLFTYFPNIFPQNTSIIQRWKLTLIFHDSKTETNSTLPYGIGILPALWVNHTLDRFGPPGYAPINTQDNTGTIYIEANHLAIFTFGDLFNIWGKPFNATCVADYCAAPAELVVYDSDNSHAYSVVDTVLNDNGTRPLIGAPLSDDPSIKFLDADHNGIWDSGETVVYDTNNNSTYAFNDPLISGNNTPTPGAQLSVDPNLRFYDANHNTVWDNAVPAPVMSDGGQNEGCVHRNYGLSDGKNWIIALHSPNLAALYGCKV